MPTNYSKLVNTAIDMISMNDLQTTANNENELTNAAPCLPSVDKIVCDIREMLNRCGICIDEILCRGFGEPPVPRHGRDINCLRDAVMDVAESSEILCEALDRIFCLLIGSMEN